MSNNVSMQYTFFKFLIHFKQLHWQKLAETYFCHTGFVMFTNEAFTK